MLDRKELGRRIKAIRMLRHMGQSELATKLEAVGLNKWDFAKVERGADDLPPALRREAALILRVPESYFLEPDLDLVLFRAPSDEVAPSPPGELGRDAEDSQTTDEDLGQGEL
jgi:transcriptional regulator with XRE-family HTH domain